VILKPIGLSRIGSSALFFALSTLIAIGAGKVSGADFYYYQGKPVVLERDPSLVGLDLAPGTNAGRIRRLGPAGRTVAVEGVEARLPKPGRVVCRIGAEGQKGKDLEERLKLLALDRRVRRAYPVFRNPKNGLPLFVFDEFVVRLRAGVGRERLERFCAQNGAEIIEQNRYEPDIFLLRATSPAESGLDAANRFARSGLCLWAEPNFAGRIDKCQVNDPLYPQQWHLNNTGQEGGTPDADVDAPEAWGITPGSPDVVIAFLDDGCDITHEDLAENIFTNPGESGDGRETNGVDDDGNGYVDDVHGWDFYDNDNDASHFYKTGATEGHGTAVAGIAAAVGDNGKGVAGLAYRCRILPLKIFKGDLYAGEYQVAEAVYYAAALADVLSDSWGGGGPSSLLDSAFRYAVEKGRGGRGCPIFFASGNNGEAVVADPGRNIWTIAVGASDRFNTRFSYSNYGPRLTLLAPSGNFTTDYSGVGAGYDGGDAAGNYTGIFGGTSSACPLAAGAGALLLSLDPNLTPIEVQMILQLTTDKINPLDAQYNQFQFSLRYGYGRLNAHRALQVVQQGITLDDQLEENDTRDEARPVENGFYSALACLDDDWYALEVSPYQEIFADIYFIHPFGDLQLELYNPEGALAAESSGTTNTEHVEANAGESGGRWLVHIFGEGGAANYYHMIINTRPPDDAFEQNDSLETAAAIEPGDYEGLRGYDADFYRVHVAAGQNIAAVIRFYNELGDLDLYLLDSNGASLSESTTLHDVEGVWYTNSGPDADFYIFVNNYGGAENKYNLHVEITPAPDDPFEQNDSQPAATPIAPGTYGPLQAYDDDWYEVGVGPYESLTAEIRFTNALGDLDLELKDQNGARLDLSEGTYDMERVTFYNATTSTVKVFPHVYPYNTNYPDNIVDYPKYTMSVAVEPIEDDEFEENDDLDHAALVAPDVYGDLTAMDDDFFGVEAEQGESLAVIVADEDSLPHLEFTIYAPSGAPLASRSSDQARVLVVNDLPTTGIYKIGIRLPTGERINRYTLCIFVYEKPPAQPGDDHFEPNDARATLSWPLAPGVFINLFGANDDYFRLRLLEGDGLYVAIVFNGSVGDMDLAVSDPWGQTVSSSSTSDSDIEMCVLDKAPMAGTYYIGVFPYSGQTNYDLFIGRWPRALKDAEKKMAARHWTLYY